ncbi:hypothetical protein [Clostridium manihotivorum]|uniref:Uncharacterized protein n=1 Tax=Clostridium manihotivorum TaxID=2320868 RepID=A0A3R5U5E9_9CLOT|nr:hypothetical protein [Clostridium manihotivorum]QAA32126.1 hypothetical protein C1I91_10940 [Clostridium manihotivorum]
MINDCISINLEEGRNFDKLKIALAIRDSTYEDGLGCSLLENEVLEDCEGCSLNYICHKVESIAKDYTDKTTKVISSFNF